MSLLTRGKSDADVLSEVAEALLPFLIQDVDMGMAEESGAEGKTVEDIEVDYKGLQCSALRLSYDGNGKKSNFLQRVVDVCDILGRLRHPNLLQFLGVSYDSRTSSPLLIVHEHLPLSLSACIDRHGVLPNEISYNIIRDVALGLRYLHEQSPPFVHGDLSAKCILLAGDFTAKISHVGVSHLRTKERNTVSSQHYHLPPEVTEHCKRFHRKVDIFSFGIVMLHTFTGRQPIPKEPTDNEEGSPRPSPNRVPSQADIRQDYINDLGTNHPVTDTVLLCLRNQPLLRPEIWEISPTLCKQAASHRNLFRKGSAHHDILYSLEKERKKKFCKFFTQVSTSDSAYGSVSEAEVEELQIRCRRLSVQNQSLRRLSLTPDHLVHLNNFCSRSLLPQPLAPDEVSCLFLLFHTHNCASTSLDSRQISSIFGICLYHICQAKLCNLLVQVVVQLVFCY